MRKLKFIYNRTVIFNVKEFELSEAELKLIEFWLSKKGFNQLPTIFPINERVYIDFISWDENNELIIGMHKNNKILNV